MAENVNFKKGTAAEYSALTAKDENTFYYTTDDGKLHIGDDEIGKTMYQQTIDLSDTTIYDEAKYYAIIGTRIPWVGENKAKVFSKIILTTTLWNSSVPSWAMHDYGFDCNMVLFVSPENKNTDLGTSICLRYDYHHTDSMPVSYSQMIRSATPVIWCRGGGKYFVTTDYDCTWTPQTSDYTTNEQTITSPIDTLPPLDLTNYSTIYANLNGNADTASKLNNALTLQLNGETKATYDGSSAVTANIETATTTTDGLMSAADKAKLDSINTSGAVTLDKTSVTLSLSKLSDTVTVTSGNAVMVVSANSDIAEASLSGNVITITVKNKGQTVVMINSNTAVSVNCNLSTDISTATPAEIKTAVQMGVAPNLWNVGDKVPIALNGTVGNITLNGTYYAFILGFNHNTFIEGGEGGNSIHFQFGKTADDVDIAFVDSNYGLEASSGFVMNTTLTNINGWLGSYMRNTICPQFLSAMPTTWQNVIASCTKCTPIPTGATLSTEDKIFLLSKYEVTATLEYSGYEDKTQKQYDYYANGNRFTPRKHNETGTNCIWWYRSIYTNGSGCFCLSSGYNSAAYSYGFVPGFMVA